MAHAPALLRTQTAPVLPPGMNGTRDSQLSGTTAALSAGHASSTSLATVSTGSTAGTSGPVMATGNIINQKADASRSLYQICVTLKQRLAQVPGFDVYLREMDEQAADGTGEGPVESLWKMLRTGHPLLAIYNSLQPDVPLVVSESEGSDAKRSKLAVFRFVKACLEQLQLKNTECFVINDLMGNDTTGFVKVSFSRSQSQAAAAD